jgi:membrane-bound lytic murein transglycosylase D
MLKKGIITLLLSGCLFQFVSAQTNNKQLLPKDTITDSNIVYPADMEANYDQLLIDWKKDKRYTDDCILSSEGTITYPDSVYIQRLYSLPTQMELVFNPVVKQYIEMYAGRRRNLVGYMLGQGQYYFPMFENALDREGLPLELKYLPVIESALNPIARSRVGATGLWQFMAGTGKLYNLEVNSLVDERRDPAKSTRAAARYLKDLYNIYGDWNLVIAAYNCGPGNVNKAIRRSGGQTDYWAIYPYLPRETRGYVPAFIAATYIMSYYSEHNICPARCEFPPSLDTIVINKNLHLQQVAEKLDISMEDLRNYNPQFKNDVVPGDYKGYVLNLPIKKISSFIDNSNDIYAHRSSELLTHRKVAGLDVVSGGSGSGGGSRVHRVKKGDTLGGIASKYGVSVAQIKKWNGLKSNAISIGKRLIVSAAPVQKSTNTKTAANTQAQKEEPAAVEKQIVTVSGTDDRTLTKVVKVSKPQTVTSYHKIRSGENLAGIAKKYGVTASDIKAWNGMRNNNLIAGKGLKIQRTQMVEVEEIVKYPDPQMPVISVNPAYAVSMMDEYLSSIERDESSMPMSRIASSGSSQHNKAEEDQIIYHKVKIGETIPQIAKRYNVTRKDIMKWNKLPSGIAKVGQRLLIYLPQNDLEGSMNGSAATQASNVALDSSNNNL